jgi:transaldolase
MWLTWWPPGVVNTMPEATLRAVADHGEVAADSVRARYDDAQEVLHRLRALGIDYGDVVQTREYDGVAKFDASWDQLGEQLAVIPRRQPTRQQRS